MLAFPRSGMNEENMSLYATVLSELSEHELKAGVLKCMRICKFFPSIAEIMEVSNEMVQVVTKTKVKSPDEAWNEVQKQMQEAFVYKKPKFSTQEIETAALAMGWIGLCETPTDQIGTARAQFLRMYESVCKRKKEDRINNNVIQIMGGQNKTAELIGKVVGQIGGKN
jgi:RNA polymerase-binding transcription factor DksA